MIAQNEPDCVLLAGRHQGLSEGIRGLLETAFKVVVMVADEMSLLESAKRLAPQMAVVDMSIARRDGFGTVRRLRAVCPTMKLIVISAHNEISVSQSALAAGADGFVLQRTIAVDLLRAVDSVRTGQRFVSPSALIQPQMETSRSPAAAKNGTTPET